MEIVVLSGKGGTGKTTIAKALSKLLSPNIRVDADVDAPNFYLYNQGKIQKQQVFYGGKKVVRENSKCTGCNVCKEVCQFGAIDKDKINLFSCEGCGACVHACPSKALWLEPEKGADMFLSQDEDGLLSYAKMEIGADGSGKLITQLRKNAQESNEQKAHILIDGSPGVGCAVMASLTNTHLAVLVTEPTLSGLSDLERVENTCRHFRIPGVVCINKCGLNPQVEKQIESFCKERDIPLVGRIPYDDTVREAINQLKPITDYKDSNAAKAIFEMAEQLKKYIY